MDLASPSVVKNEVEKFAKIAEEWWDEGGKFKPLHQLNLVRIKYIKDNVTKHFGINSPSLPLKGLRFLDVGCGGGLLTVPLGKLGAQIMGIDVTKKNIKVANTYKKQNDLGDNINFLYTTVEDLEGEGEKFDVVIAMEVIEHVADINIFMKSCIRLLKPDGLIFVSTLNKTLKSYLLAIIGAEYILRWVPVGTHSWDKFLAPSEINSIFDKNNVHLNDLCGVTYSPVFQKWSLSADLSVNYMMYGIKHPS